MNGQDLKEWEKFAKVRIGQSSLDSLSDEDRIDALRDLLEATLESQYGEDSSAEEVLEYAKYYKEVSKDPYKAECLVILHEIYKELSPNAVKIKANGAYLTRNLAESFVTKVVEALNKMKEPRLARSMAKTVLPHTTDQEPV